MVTAPEAAVTVLDELWGAQVRKRLTPAVLLGYLHGFSPLT